MCGRFKLTSTADIVADLLGVSPSGEIASHEEIFPTNAVSVLRLGERTGVRELSLLRWGLIPRWAREETNLFNARAETLLDKPSFREAFSARRCLIPADGFFEWPLLEGKKRKTLIQRKDRRPFAFAGLWERWQSKADARVIESCTIIPSEPTQFILPIPKRMPVIRGRDRLTEWLSPRSLPEDLLARLLQPAEWPAMEAMAVQ